MATKTRLNVREIFISQEQKLNLGNYESAGFNAGIVLTVGDELTKEEILGKHLEMVEIVQGMLESQVNKFKKLNVQKG